MAREKSEKTKAQIATETARKALAEAKDKAEKAPNNKTLQDAVAHAKTRLHEAVKAENRERFLKVGVVRMNKAIKALSTLQNVANPRSYEFADADVSKMLASLKKEYEGVANAFEAALKGTGKGEAASGFTFD